MRRCSRVFGRLREPCVLTFPFMDIYTLLTSVDAMVWGPAMICLLLGTHIYLTIRTGFIQRKLPTAIKMSVVVDEDSEGDVTQFGALATALASTIGTGSIVGVATAILAGGPGAVLWMWLTGVFGIATKYCEVYASIRYRVKDSRGEMLGGAMYAWERAFKRTDGSVPWWAKLFAVLFCVFAVVATLGTGSAVQSAAITGIICSSIPGMIDWIIGLVIMVAVAAVIFGGVKTITNVSERLVPIMAVLYLGGCIIVLVANAPYLGQALQTIVECALTPKAAFGGAVGSGVLTALQYGCARGLFSNESGLGTAPIVAAAAATKNPARQSLVAMTGTFWSTVVICLMTGVAIVAVLTANPAIMEAGSIKEGAALASAAFATIPYVGTPILIIGMVSFAYTTILGWSYYGSRCVTYLFGRRAIRPYQVVYVLVGFFGAIGAGDAVWLVSDIGNALMAVPNIIVLLALSGTIARETRHYVYDGHLDETFDEEIPVVATK